MQHTGILCAKKLGGILCAKKLGVGLQLVARDVGGGLPPSAAARPPRHAAALAATGAGMPPRSPLSGDGAAMEAKQLQQKVAEVRLCLLRRSSTSDDAGGGTAMVAAGSTAPWRRREWR
jgi:hypothetical protein